ncbi:hypothetical protein ABPG75_011560 [Micractinium tetrahymenae]
MYTASCNLLSGEVAKMRAGPGPMQLWKLWAALLPSGRAQASFFRFFAPWLLTTMQVLQPALPPDAGAPLFLQQARYQPAGPPPLPMGPPTAPLPGQPPLPTGAPPSQAQQALPPALLANQQHHQQAAAHPPAQQQQQGAAPPGGKRKKRGRRGSGFESRSRGVQKQRGASGMQLGFFGQVPSLSDMRQENWRRTQQHYGGGTAAAGGIAGPLRPFPAAPRQHHGPGRAGSHRRARNKASKQAKLLHPPSAPRPKPLTPAVGNPLDTPANVGQAAAEPAPGSAKPEVEGLQAGLDWYGTNEDNAALFLTGQQLTTSDSEGDDFGDDFDGEGSDGEAGGSGGGSGGRPRGGAAAGGGTPGEGGPADDAALPRHVRSRLVEQEAYIAELEDQNLRLREQLEMAQQEVEELRARGGGGPADSEEGWAEHSEGSLPGDLSVMQQHHQPQQHHSQAL